MKVLIVARFINNTFSPFVMEQVAALQKEGVICDFFPLRFNGIHGYLKELPGLRRTIKAKKPDLIHAHNGPSGLFANLQRMVPVVTTFHGSDINNPHSRKLSKIAISLSAYSVFVSQKLIDLAKPTKNYALVPCGINLEDYPIIDKAKAKQIMGFNPDRNYVIFSGAFDNYVKNAPLAKEAVSMIPDTELLEMKGYTRSQVAVLMQAVDALIMTSHTEGSPQIIKEALTCCTPIVSVDVGDVSDRINGLEGCYISDRNAQELANALRNAILFNKRTKGRDVIIDNRLTNDYVAKSLVEIYEKVRFTQH